MNLPDDNKVNLQQRVKLFTALLTDFDIFLRLKDKQSLLNLTTSQAIMLEDILLSEKLVSFLTVNSKRKKEGIGHQTDIGSSPTNMFNNKEKKPLNKSCFSQKIMGSLKIGYNTSSEVDHMKIAIKDLLMQKILNKFVHIAAVQKKPPETKSFILVNSSLNPDNNPIVIKTKNSSVKDSRKYIFREARDEEFILTCKRSISSRSQSTSRSNNHSGLESLSQTTSTAQRLYNSRMSILKELRGQKELSKRTKEEIEIHRKIIKSKKDFKESFKLLFKLGIKNSITNDPICSTVYNELESEKEKRKSGIRSLVSTYRNLKTQKSREKFQSPKKQKPKQSNLKPKDIKGTRFVELFSLKKENSSLNSAVVHKKNDSGLKALFLNSIK